MASEWVWVRSLTKEEIFLQVKKNLLDSNIANALIHFHLKVLRQLFSLVTNVLGNVKENFKTWTNVSKVLLTTQRLNLKWQPDSQTCNLSFFPGCDYTLSANEVNGILVFLLLTKYMWVFFFPLWLTELLDAIKNHHIQNFTEVIFGKATINFLLIKINHSIFHISEQEHSPRKWNACIIFPSRRDSIVVMREAKRSGQGIWTSECQLFSASSTGEI